MIFSKLNFEQDPQVQSIFAKKVNRITAMMVKALSYEGTEFLQPKAGYEYN